VAAMPSLHAGMTVLIALYAIQRLRSRGRWLLLAYPVAMSTALVYYGEHYVVDVLAGALLAVLVLLGCKVWEDTRGT
jgi:membrane-associated phospholipid phosphatase